MQLHPLPLLALLPVLASAQPAVPAAGDAVFHTALAQVERAVQAAKSDDLAARIRDLESRASWHGVDAEYAQRDVGWSRQLLMQYLADGARNVAPLYQAERQALGAAESCKRAQLEAEKTAAAAAALKPQAPDADASREAMIFLETARKFEAQSLKASQAAAELLSLVTRNQRLTGLRMQRTAEALDREARLLSWKAQDVAREAEALIRRLTEAGKEGAAAD